MALIDKFAEEVFVKRYSLLLALIVALTGLAAGQEIPTRSNSPLANIRRMSKTALSGDPAAVDSTFNEMAAVAGAPVEDLSAIGVKDRVLNAEAQFRKGLHPPIPDVNVVRAVNSLASRLGTL